MATFETRAGRVRSNKIEVNVYFLTSRKQRVLIEGQASDWLSVTSGVPQGSILGPLLFLAYVNDLPYSVTCNSDLFADDTVLHRHIENRSDYNLLQEDLTSASEWCKSCLVTLKTEKCEVLHMTRKNDPIRCQYSLNNILLPEVDHHKHLGLCCSLHTSTIFLTQISNLQLRFVC